MAVPVIYPPPDGVHLDCELCDLHFFSVDDQRSSERLYKTRIDDDEAQTAITSLLTDAKNNIDYVIEKLNSHGDLILKRWSKRSRDRRKELMSNAAGHIFGEWARLGPLYSPEYVESRKRQIGTERWRWAERIFKSGAWGGCWFGQWLKVTELAEDWRRMIVLLHVRTTYSAQDWTAFDICQLAGAWCNADGSSEYNPHCVRICGKDFGRLEPFDPDLAHARVILGFPHASTIFVGQGALARALRNIVDAVVMEAPATGNSRWLEMFADTNSLYASSGEGRWSQYVHPGFAPPLTLDTDALLQTSRGKFNQIVDDIEILQTDVEYMYKYVMVLKADIN